MSLLSPAVAAALVCCLLCMNTFAAEIIAHRGASADAPENTITAERLGYEQGADGGELDVHLSKDGIPVIIHDADTKRVAGVDVQQRHAMGPRFFQHLVDRRVGANNAVQFIGHIPQSKAQMHRHLYEEALVIVSGEGVIWNENSRAPVRPGDVIFFPRKHVHSLQCTSPDGMDVVGMIHPGENPGINY